MGATEFEVYGFGHSPAAAFNTCVREAHHEWGHDSYNGSISTVRDYQVFDVPPRAKVERVAELVWLLYNAPDNQVKYSPDRIKVLTGQMGEVNGLMSGWKTKWKTHLLPKGLTQLDLLAMVASIEKWESCCALRVTGTAAQNKRMRHGWKGLHGDVYYFFGLAAC